MTCSSWNVGSVQPGRVQVPSGILVPWSRIPFPVAPYRAPPAAAEPGAGWANDMAIGTENPFWLGLRPSLGFHTPGGWMHLEAGSPGPQGGIDRIHQFAGNLQGHLLGRLGDGRLSLVEGGKQFGPESDQIGLAPHKSPTFQPLRCQMAGWF